MNIHRGSDFNDFMIEEGLTNTDQPMTPTPRTDAAEILWNDTGLCVVPAEFARYLERENQTFRAAQKACEDCDAPRVDRIAELERELATERALADRLAGLLENCRDDSCELLGERGWWKDEPRCDYSKRYDETAENIAMADESLAAWKEARRGTV